MASKALYGAGIFLYCTSGSTSTIQHDDAATIPKPLSKLPELVTNVAGKIVSRSGLTAIVAFSESDKSTKLAHLSDPHLSRQVLAISKCRTQESGAFCWRKSWRQDVSGTAAMVTGANPDC